MTSSEQYDASNRAAALAILEAPERHPPVIVEWARMFLARRGKLSNSNLLDSRGTRNGTGQQQLFPEAA